MKVFLQFESIFPYQPIEMDGKLYKENELNKLHGYSFPVHKYFNHEEDVVSEGKLFWNENLQKLSMRVWLSPEDINFFERSIISGTLVPSNVRLTPDNIRNEDVKTYFDEEM